MMDLGQPGGDVGQRLVPGDGLEAVRSATQRRGDPIGVVDHLGERDALLAGETRRQRMLLVRPKCDQATVLDGGHHAAKWLADPAERRLVLNRGYHPQTRYCNSYS